MGKEYYDIRIRIKDGTKIDRYIKENKEKSTTLAKLIASAVEGYIDFIEGKNAVDENGNIYDQQEQLDIKEIKELMKDIKRVNRRLESYIFDRIVSAEKKGA